MKRFLSFLFLLMAIPGLAWGEPRVSGPDRSMGPTTTSIKFLIGDTADSPAIGVSGYCSVRFQQASGDDVSLYAVTTATTAASSGTLLKAFTASTSPSNPVYTFTASTQWVKAVATDATAGGSVMTIECSPLVGAGGGAQSDSDGDGYYEVAYLWDADGDGSTWTECTGNATPDIGCKAIGEKLYRDAIDDLNCAVHGCGLGQMENNGTVILGEGVFVGWPCWTPTNGNTPEAHETNDNAHDTAVTDAAYDDCPVDGDNEPLIVLSLEDWQGTILGSGADTRLLERGSMSATLRRDIGTYFVNDMGPWDVTKNNNVWFSGADNARMISTGFHTNVGDTNHPNGASATDNSTSKGWWRIGTNVDFTTFISDGQTLCLINSGGTAATDYKTDSTVTNLRPGDVIIVPFKPAGSSTYNTLEAVVRATPSVTCSTTDFGAGTGYYVDLGGSYIDRAVATRTYIPHAASITESDNQKVLHVRSGYDNTKVTIANLRVEPMDPWNEFGGRCTNSGTAFKTLVTDTGTLFSTSTDDTNTDMSCDTLPFFGLWGGGKVTFDGVVVANFHKYAFDAGGTGYADIINTKFLFGNGGEIADLSNGWRLYNTIVDQSYFGSQVINIFGVAPQVDTLTVTNSVFPRVLYLDEVSPHAIIQNIRDEGNSSLYTIGVLCGAQQSIVRDVYKTGKAGNTTSGNSPTVIYIECDDTAALVTQNTFENIILDGPDTSAGAESPPVVTFNVPAASGNSADAQWAAIQGNIFRGVRATGYGTAVDPEAVCLYGVMEADADSPPDDDGESVIFTKNYFSGGSVVAAGKIFCMTNSSGSAAINNTAIDSTGAATPAWGDPVGCGNFDGPVVYADENCS